MSRTMRNKTSKTFNVLGFLFEADDEEGSGEINAAQPSVVQQPAFPTPENKQDDSLDRKVDRFLMQYERLATLGPDTTDPALATLPIDGTSAPLAESIFEFIISEAEGDDPSDPFAGGDDDLGGGDDVPMPDLGGDDSPADGNGSGPQPPDLSTEMPQIDINSYAENVARLVNNYPVLLDPRTTIINRAIAYITKNYNTTMGKEIENILADQFGLSGKTDNQKIDALSMTPLAATNGGDGSSGLSSGGGSSAA